MNDPKPTPKEWSDSLLGATEHVKERVLAGAQAAHRQKPRSQGALILAATIILAGVIAWDVHVITRPPAMPLPADEAVDLRWFVADAVEVIERFRADEGRLPSQADLADLLGEAFSFEIRGDGYLLAVQGQGTHVQYDASLSLDEWVLGTTADAADRGAP